MSTVEEPAEKKTRIGVRSLTTAGNVRSLLGKLIKKRLAEDDGGVDNETLRAVVQACSVLLKSIEQETIDDRLQAIEKQLSEYEKERL